jgi:hypothetical protein
MLDNKKITQHYFMKCVLLQYGNYVIYTQNYVMF